MISIGLSFDESASLPDYIISSILLIIGLIVCIAIYFFVPLIGLFVDFAGGIYFFIASLALYARRMNFRGKSRLNCLWLLAPMATGALLTLAMQKGAIGQAMVIAVIGGICSVIASCLALMVDIEKGDPNTLLKRIWNILVVLFFIIFAALNVANTWAGFYRWHS